MDFRNVILKIKEFNPIKTLNHYLGLFQKVKRNKIPHILSIFILCDRNETIVNNLYKYITLKIV